MTKGFKRKLLEAFGLQLKDSECTSEKREIYRIYMTFSRKYSKIK